MHILIIEDEFALADLIKTKLNQNNYETDISTDGEEGLYMALTNVYDLIILDIMLPNIDGFTILKKIREESIKSKVIILTAKGDIEDKLTGLNKGANDYLTKPFHMDELLARINIELKDPATYKDKNIITYEDLELNTNTSTLTCTKTLTSVQLVCKELKLLSYFLTNPNQILSKEQIYNKVWGIENEIESNNLEAYLSFIRRKLQAINSKVNIKAIRGLGYKTEVNNDQTKK